MVQFEARSCEQVLTSEYGTMYLRELRDVIGLGGSKLAHPDLQRSRIWKDDADFEFLVDLMENSWLNPMCHEETELVSLSTGTVAPADVAKYLLGAHQVGEEAYQMFKKKCLEQAPPTMKFHDKMTKQNLNTFSNVNTKKASGRGKAKEVVLKVKIKLFGHMILVAQSRQLHTRDVLAQPLGPLPWWALANALRKTTKVALARELERSVSPAEDNPDPSTCTIDGMSLVQKMNGNKKTFAQLAESVMSLVLREGSQSHRIDVVVDVYRETSTKNTERCNRGSSTAIQ